MYLNILGNRTQEIYKKFLGKNFDTLATQKNFTRANQVCAKML